jgi:integrase
VSATAHDLRTFDPLKDKSYAATRLGRSVVDFLAWMELGGAADRTLDQYERDLSRACLMFPDKGVADITEDDLLHIARSFKPAERRVRVAAYRSFFKWARKRRLIVENPTEVLPDMKRRPQRVADVFRDPEIASLLALDVIDAAPLAVLIDGGLRKAEARHLKLRHCAPENGQLIVVNGKGGRDRIVPMSQRLRALITDLALLERLAPNDHLFYAVRANKVSRKVTRSTPVGEGTFARWWADCLERAQVRYRSPHTARHTFATSWRRRGFAVDELQEMLGHASISTTSDLYVHTGYADIARRMAEIEERESLSPERVS